MRLRQCLGLSNELVLWSLVFFLSIDEVLVKIAMHYLVRYSGSAVSGSAGIELMLDTQTGFIVYFLCTAVVTALVSYYHVMTRLVY